MGPQQLLRKHHHPPKCLLRELIQRHPRDAPNVPETGVVPLGEELRLRDGWREDLDDFDIVSVGGKVSSLSFPGIRR